MIAIILPTLNSNFLSPLTDWVPESMLPIANKPILEHQIELLAQHNIKEILVFLKHKPSEVKDYFGCGERWGVKLNYIVMQQFNGVLNALQQIPKELEGPLFCMQGNALSNPEITQILKAHERWKSEITLCLPSDKLYPGPVSILNEDLMSKFHFIIESKTVTEVLKSLHYDLLPSSSIFLNTNVKPFNCKSFTHFYYLDSPKSYWETNLLFLEKKIDGLIFKGKEISKGIWVGAHSDIHPEAILRPPVVIGEHCVINKDAVIENGSVIGDSSIIEEGAFVTRSIIWKGTYAGTQTQIENSIANKNHLFQIPRQTMLKVPDPFILGNSDPGLYFTKKLFNKTGYINSSNRLFASLSRFAERLIIAFKV